MSTSTSRVVEAFHDALLRNAKLRLTSEEVRYADPYGKAPIVDQGELSTLLTEEANAFRREKRGAKRLKGISYQENSNSCRMFLRKNCVL